MEMSFVEQEDIFKIVEPIFFDLFNTFAKGKKIFLSHHSKKLLIKIQC